MARERHEETPAPPTEGVDPTGAFGTFLRRLEQIGNHHGAAQRSIWDKLLERFRALRPENFDGMTEPWKAKQWIRKMDQLFETMVCSELDKRRLAVFQLTYAAADWWESKKARFGEEASE